MEHYAGIDVSLECSSVCVVHANGKILREARVASEPEALIGWFRSVSNIPRAFAVQSMVAEIASATKRDPKDMLLELIGSPRIVNLSSVKDPWN